MRRRELSKDELKQVIELREAKCSWSEIQRKTGINRRIVKRAYDEWERSKSVEELSEVRKGVAAQAFSEHMNSLLRLAVTLVILISLPDKKKNSEQFFSWLWQQDLLQSAVFVVPDYTIIDTTYRPDNRAVLDMQFNIRGNQLLFESLQFHTRENVQWNVLNQWKNAKDNSVENLRKLREETVKVVNNFLNQERQTDLLYRIKEGSGEDDPVDQMTEVVLTAIWQGILESEVDQESPLVHVVSEESSQDIVVKVRDEVIFRFIDKNLAEKVTHICNLAVNNLCKGDMVQQLYCEVRKMKKATEELRQMLNPVRLTPIILRTRCDLCPA